MSEDDVTHLARFAGLAIPAERLPRVTAELNATLAIIADLEDIAPSDLAPAIDTFDPAWPPKAGKA